MSSQERRPPLYDWHVNAGAEVVLFGGWRMPLQYRGISEEHIAVREKAGLFDTSHMGRILINGPKALDFVQHVSVNDIQRLPDMGVQYSCICNRLGGVLDDILAYRMSDDNAMIVCNASNHSKILGWTTSHSRQFQVKVRDITDSVPMFALQGIKAEKIAEKAFSVSLSGLKPWRSTWHQNGDLRLLLSRTGYTGEDGFEIFVWHNGERIRENALISWNKIIDSGKGEGLLPVGLGARDTLRLEAGLPLYGNELDESTTPIEARLDFIVKTDKPAEYVGKDVLLRQKKAGVSRVRIGFRMMERGVPRKGYDLLTDGHVAGHVTSGTFSPLLQVGIGMGYLPFNLSEEERRISVGIRGKRVSAQICRWPFYNPDIYGARRKST